MLQRILQLILFAFTPLIISTATLGIDAEGKNINSLSKRDKTLASSLFKDYEKYQGNHKKRTEIIRQMMGLGRPVAQKMFDIIDRDIRKKWPLYQGGFTASARKTGARKNTVNVRNEIAALQLKVQSLRSMGKGLTKEKIIRIGDPALKRLHKIKVIEMREIFNSNSKLSKQRESIVALAEQRSVCIDRLVLREDEAETFGLKEISGYEKLTASLALGPPLEHLQILNLNSKINKSVPPKEAAAVRDMNQYRILIGLRPCLLDPLLCLASREHSKDMREKKFFAHKSPIPGKKNPWERAKLAGTTANAENIFKGNKEGHAANQAWWHSPGHHINMLSPNAKRVGMGVNEKHWTQMFGP
tara:strand:+ start:1030 stop:2103 length:1074 start_codon:yes stop_codon:yes gene_type:complete